MQAATRQSPPWQGDIQRFSRQLTIQFSLLQRVTPLFQCGFNGLLGFVNAGAGRFALLGRHRAQAFQQFGQLAAFT